MSAPIPVWICHCGMLRTTDQPCPGCADKIVRGRSPKPGAPMVGVWLALVIAVLAAFVVARAIGSAPERDSVPAERS